MNVVSFRNDSRISEKDRSTLRRFVGDLGDNIVALANELGVKVFEVGLPLGTSGFMEYAPSCGSDSGYRIVINENDSPGRKKFTVAHELGHYVLHRNDPTFKKIMQKQADILDIPRARRLESRSDYAHWQKRFEYDADAFAAEVLLPRNLVRKTPEYLTGDPSGLAVRLGLSEQFVEFRFRALRHGTPNDQGKHIQTKYARQETIAA